MWIEAVWQIRDFTEEIQNRYEEETTFKESVYYNMVDKWFKDLENKGIHYIQWTTETNKKVYDELDLSITVFIIKKRTQKWSLDAIFNMLPEHIEVRACPNLSFGDSPEINEVLMMQEMSRQLERMQK